MRLLQILCITLFIGGWQVQSIAQVEDDIFTIVDKMPMFPGCEGGENNDERRKCTETELLRFMYKNIKYPADARENGVEGLVVITFVINKEGNIEGTKVLKDIGGGCGEESARVINSMNEMPLKWIPGEQKGEKVKVRYNLPVRFKLRNDEEVTKPDTLTQADKELILKQQYESFGLDQEADKAAGIYDFMTVSDFPVYPGCQTIEGGDERQFCSEIRLMNYIYANMFYPMLARVNDLEGTVYATFIISETGKIEGIKILKDIGSGCGDEVIRVVNNMNDEVKWKPATLDGKDVKVRLIVSIDFKKK